jgi:hypothetical protein
LHLPYLNLQAMDNTLPTKPGVFAGNNPVPFLA